MSPQDSALLSDIVEVGSLPCIVRESEEIWHCFYIVTRYGLRIECSSGSEIQVHSVVSGLGMSIHIWSTVTLHSVKTDESTESTLCNEHAWNFIFAVT